jgi:hypothetical protein
MKKAQCRESLSSLYSVWREARGLPLPDGSLHFSFSDFKTWLCENHYSRFLNFRSTAGSEYDAERWFDDEHRQAWRN